MATFGKIEQFSGQEEDFEQYTERLELYFEANDLNKIPLKTDQSNKSEVEAREKKRKAILLSVIGPSAYKILRNLTSPEKANEKPYEEIITLLRNHFAPKPSQTVQRFKFHSRVRSQGEKISDFIADLRKLAEGCDFGESLNDMLRDRLVCGIADDKIQNRLLIEQDLTFLKAYNIAICQETAARDASILHNAINNQPTTVNKISGYKNHGKDTSIRQKEREKLCYRCGSPDHLAPKCRFQSTECNYCHKVGHLEKVCRSKRLSRKASQGFQANTVVVEEMESNSDTEEIVSTMYMYNVKSVQGGPPLQTDITVNEIPITFQVDTGAGVTIMNQTDFLLNFGEVPLAPTRTVLHSYTGDKIKVLGEKMVSVKLGEQYLDLPLIIVDEKGPPLLGRTWLQKLKLPWKEIFAVRKGHSEEPLLTEILNEHEDLFNTEPGCLKDFKAKLQIEENTNPIFCKARPLPFSMKKRVEEELNRLENNGVIRKVSHSEWATPVVPVIKPSGAIRLCGDYKTTLNTVLKMDRYPLPLVPVDEIFANLAGGQKFTKLDLSEAYHQLCLDEESQKLTTINTHCGLYEYLYLPYGVNSAVGIFQCAIESTMKGLPGISVYMDDILVTGKDDSEHLSNLQGALTRLQEKGLKLQKSKCKFLLSEVEYLGFKISGDGIQPTESKVRAIREAPHPNNVSELRSFLGMVNYYARFLPNLAHQLSPMYDLLKKDTKWTWERNQQSAFKKIKELMSEDTLLEHYDANAEIVLECDASSTGVGAVLKQRTSSDKLKPVVFASRRLTAAERGPPTPSETVWENKGIPQLAAARIKRWALILSAYRYKVEYITSKENACADYLSRAPILDLPTQDETLEDEVLTIATTLPKDIALSEFKSVTPKDANRSFMSATAVDQAVYLYSYLGFYVTRNYQT
ncbi:hypothetical protein QZH41_001130 [Actinostola sp. cb2023]|nr:hypothetical protein QZH41_001130 [Actinostola sp. cb2023]